MRDLVILGGGISGLSTAFYAARRGIHPTIIESSPRLGGVIQTDTIQDCVIEAGPDSFLASKPAALQLIEELGLKDEVIGSNDHLRVTYIRKGGRFIPMPDGLMMMVPTKIMPMALSPLMSWSTKFRMAREYFRKPAQLPERSVADLIADHYGQEAVDYLAEPLLSGVYGGDPRELSASSVLAQFVEFESKYGSLTRGMLERRKNTPPSGPLFRTLKRGLGSLVEALQTQTAADIIHGAARAVRRIDSGFRIELEDAGTIDAHQLAVSTPAWRAGAVLETLDAPLADLLKRVAYNSSTIVALGYDRQAVRHPLNGFGFLVPKVERRSLVACTWIGTKFPFRVPPDKAVLRCFFGGSVDHKTDAEVVGIAREEIRLLMNVDAVPSFHAITRWHRSMAQYTVGHSTLVTSIQERAQQIPGLYLAGNAYEGIGVPDCIRMGRQVAGRLTRNFAAL
jgi:oxygen-dependent protoporphyrinogen oxidase